MGEGEQAQPLGAVVGYIETIHQFLCYVELIA